MLPDDLKRFRLERLQAAIDHRQFGGNVTAFGRALGYRDGAFVRQMVKGERPVSEKTVHAIEALPGMKDWFRLDRYAVTPNVVSLHVGEPTPSEVIAVPVYDVRFSAGPGHAATYEIEEASQPAYYQRDWFVKQRINPEHARRFRVAGDSMEPFVYARDHVLVDTGDTDVQDGRIYALRYGNELRLKRVWRHLDGTLVLKSDNPRYVDESVPPDVAAEHISIIGRVRDRSGSGGL